MDELNLKIEYVPIDSIRPYERNAKLHPPEQIEQIKESIRQVGFRDPIGIWHGEIVEGHGRHIAAKELGMETVPVIKLDDMTDEERRAYMLIHNQTTMNSGWDIDLLDFEIDDITDIDMTKWFDRNVVHTNDENEVVEDDFDINEKPETRAKLGDIWKLGKHRVMCGSSTNADDVNALMQGVPAPLLFTSPPYSDIREYEGGKDLSVANIARFISAYAIYAKIQAVNLGIQRRNYEIVQYWDEYVDVARSAGLKLLAWNVWDKLMCGSVGQQSAMVPIRHEWIFCFGKEPVKINLTWNKQESSIYSDGRRRKVRQPDGSMKESSCGVSSRRWKQMESLCKIPEKWSLDSVTEQLSEVGTIRSEHPATFPVFLPAEYIIAFTDKGDTVIEPFGGSGTTLIACEQLGRSCRCMELEPKYVDVILSRWEKFTGEKAVLLNG